MDRSNWFSERDWSWADEPDDEEAQEGEYNAGEWPIYRNSLIFENENDSRVAHRALIADLSKDGWESYGRGSDWWNDRFRRRIEKPRWIRSTIYYSRKIGLWSIRAKFCTQPDIGESEEFVGIHESYMVGVNPNATKKMARIVATHERILERLVREGWEVDGKCYEWWQTRIRRRK
ncbi:MAG: hypothetical protein WCD37_01585 [Chloroflexia bacterium]